MTGTDIALLIAIASVLLAVGVALAATRRRSSVSP
jgi:hypothetical protein